MLKQIGLVTILGSCALPLFGQCEGKTGFALEACKAHNTQAQLSTASGPGSVKPDGLSTSYSDSIHGNTLPSGLDLTAPKPLDKLERADDGSFVLAAGIFEENVECFSLDAGTLSFGKGGDLFPAPIKGAMAGVIARVLKLAELHPEISHDAIQQLLSGLLLGTDLGKMSPQAQQAATVLLTKEQIAQLHPAPPPKNDKKGGGVLGDWLERERDAVVGAALGRVQNQANAASQKAGMPGAVVVPSVTGTPQATQTERQTEANPSMAMANAYQMMFQAATGKPVGGAWVEMGDGYYLRYVPDGMGRVRIQLIVPDAVISTATGRKILFDPTLLIAVTSGSPGHRLGITMRTAGQQWQ